jgi:hypothetical protein
VDQHSVRLIIAARLLALLRDGENEQAIVAAARTLGEMVGALGAKATPMEDVEQRRATSMSPAEMRRELDRLARLQ